MTPSEPNKKSSMWYSQGQEVLRGFECGFNFQITDQSRTCRNVKTADFGLHQYEVYTTGRRCFDCLPTYGLLISVASLQACRVHGGDGFAFVIHSHPNGTATIGEIVWRSCLHCSNIFRFFGITNVHMHAKVLALRVLATLAFKTLWQYVSKLKPWVLCNIFQVRCISVSM